MGTLADYGEDRFGALMKACADSYTKMQPFREEALSNLGSYVGRYGESADAKPAPMNLMQLAVGIYKRQVAAREPSFIVVPQDPKLKPAADDFEGALNATVRRTRLRDATDECVTAAMFGMGVMKVGLDGGGEKFADDQGFTHDAGAPFADPVLLDDFVFDMQAWRWPKVRFAGDAFDVTEDGAKKRGWDVRFGQVGNRDTNAGGDARQTSLQTGGGASYNADDYLRSARCWELWLPHEGIIMWVQADASGGFNGARYLGHAKWTGPDSGPYHVLWFDKPAGNIYPVPPTGALQDMHDAANDVLTKEIASAQRKKTVGVVGSSDTSNAELINNAKDGEVVAINGGVQQEIKFGGASAEGIALFLQMREMFSYIGGNIDSIGGLARAAGTVGQESLINRGANARIASMQESVLTWMTGIGNALGAYVWGNPGKGPRFMKKIADYEVPWHFTVKDGELEDYGIVVEPYSMQSRTPSERVQDIMEVVANIVLPMSPQLAAQGKKVDLDTLLGYIAKYKSMPELNGIVVDMTQEELAMAQQGSQERPTQSPVTRRESVRTNVSGTPGPNAAMEFLKMSKGSA